MPPKKLSSLADKMQGDFSLVASKDTPRIIEVEIDQIDPNPDQPRKSFDPEGLQELASSIAEHGQLQPILIKKREDAPGRYLLVAGERRYRAHQILSRHKIYAVITKGNEDELALIENLQRENLNPLEEAMALARLMERHAYTQETLGKVVGKRQSTVSNLLRLNSLPEPIKSDYSTSNNPPSKSVLIELAYLKNPDDQLRMWEEIKQGRATTVRATREKKEAGEVRTPQSPATKLLAAARSVAKQLKRMSGDREALNRDQLTELIELRDQINAEIEAFVKV